MSILFTACLALCGLLYGSLVGFFNHLLLVKGWQQITPQNLRNKRLKKLKQNVMIRYALHLLIDVIALFLVAKWVPVLLGTAAGIIITQKILIVKYIKTNKEVRS